MPAGLSTRRRRGWDWAGVIRRRGGQQRWIPPITHGRPWYSSLGIEPAENIAEVARAKGIDTEVMFLGEETGRDVAARHGKADLVVANNVFAHVPDIVDFSKGLAALVADSGRVSIEIPHLLRLIEGNEYDTIITSTTPT